MTPAERTALVSATIHERAQGDPGRLAREIVDRIERRGSSSPARSRSGTTQQGRKRKRPARVSPGRPLWLRHQLHLRNYVAVSPTASRIDRDLSRWFLVSDYRGAVSIHSRN